MPYDFSKPINEDKRKNVFVPKSFKPIEPTEELKPTQAGGPVISPKLEIPRYSTVLDNMDKSTHSGPSTVADNSNIFEDIGKGFWQGGIRTAAEGYKQDGLNILYAAQQEALAKEKRLGITPLPTGKSYLDPTANSADFGNQYNNLEAQVPYEPTTTSGKIGNVVGNLVGSAPAFAVGGAAMEGIANNAIGKIAPKIAPKLLPWVDTAVKGSASLAPVGLMESDTLSEIPENVAKNVALGAVMGVGLKGAGIALKPVGNAISKGVDNTKSFLKPRGVPEVTPIEPRTLPLTPKVPVQTINTPENIPLQPSIGNQQLIESPNQFQPKVQETVSKPFQQQTILNNTQINSQSNPYTNTLGTTKPSGVERLSFPDTVARGEITNPELRNQLTQSEQNYGSIKNKDTLALAQDYINNNRNEAENLVMSNNPPTAESNTVAQLLIKEHNDSGAFDKAIRIIEHISQKAKTQGQAIQALSMWGKLSPEGILRYAQKTIENIKTPEEVLKINSTSDKLAQEMAGINSDAVDSVVKDVGNNIDKILNSKGAQNASKPLGTEINAKEVTNTSAETVAKETIKPTDAEILAKRIGSTLKESKDTQEKDMTKFMVDTLYKVAKESPLPTKEKIASNPLDFVADAIKNRDKYREVWNEAKKLVTAKYSDNPEALALLDDYFAKNIKRTFPENQLNNSVGQGLKDMGQNIGVIVKEHYTVNSNIRTSLVQKLVNEAGLSGEDANILEKYIRNRMKDLTKTKKEQLLAQMFKTRLAPVRKEISQKIIELSNLGGFQNDTYKSLVGEKFGLPSLDEGTAKTLYEMSQKIQTMVDGSREKDVAIAKMLDVISAKIPVSNLQKIATLQTMAQLLNPKTAIRNIGGNAGFAVAENTSNVLGAGIDKGLSVFTGKRSLVLPDLKAQAKGMEKGWKLGLEDAVKGINTSSLNTQYDIGVTKTFRTGILSKLETGMNIELRATDRAFYQGAYEQSLSNQMKANKVTFPTDAMKEIADHEALYNTFQDKNALSDLFSGVKKGLNKLTGSEKFGIGDFIIKYPKTPANLLARGIDYSPAGFFKVIMEASKPLMGKPFNQRAFVQAFSRSLVGTSLMGTGALMHRIGIVTGSSNSDPDVATLQRDSGLGENKINVSALKRFVLNGFDITSAKLQKGDLLINYDWFQPLAIPIAMGADIDRNDASASGVMGTLLNALSTSVNAFATQPVMQGINSLVGSRDKSSAMYKVLQGIPASFIATFLNQVKQLLDNQKRETYSPNFIEKMGNLSKTKIPFIEKSIQPSYNTLGTPRETYQNGSNNAFNIFLNPAFPTKYDPTKEAEMALNLYDKTGETRQIPTAIDKKFTVGGKSFVLSSKEYADMQKIVGEQTQKDFAIIADNPNQDQVDRLAKAIERARLEGKKKILEQRNVPFYESGNTLKLITE